MAFTNVAMVDVKAFGPEVIPVLTSMSTRIFSIAARLNERCFNLVGPLLPRPDRSLIGV